MSKSIGYLLLRVLGIFMPVNCKLDFIEKTSFLTHGEVRSRLGVDVIYSTSVLIVAFVCNNLLYFVFIVPIHSFFFVVGNR